MRFNFEWDPVKARQNIQRHRVSFERAATVFADPNQLTIFDGQHSDDEDRWITSGMDNNGVLLVVVHTFEQINVSETRSVLFRLAKQLEEKPDSTRERIHESRI